MLNSIPSLVISLPGSAQHDGLYDRTQTPPMKSTIKLNKFCNWKYGVEIRLWSDFPKAAVTVICE